MNGMVPDLKLLIRLKDVLGSNETTFGFYSFMDAPTSIKMLWRVCVCVEFVIIYF